MDWRGSQADSRNRYLAKYNAAEVDRYDSLVGRLTGEDEEAYLSDLNRVFSFRAGMEVLDVGAGTGTVCKLLSRLEGLSITALEPAPAMLAKFKSKPLLVGSNGFPHRRRRADGVNQPTALHQDNTLRGGRQSSPSADESVTYTKRQSI